MVQGFDLGQTRDDTLITPREFKVSVDYDFGRGHVHQDHEVNLGAYFQTGQDRSEILEELEKIRKVLEKKLGPGS
ncbi:MAG: hypothetical protein K0S06_3804 [Microvirga sp.]|nr:hypothetical protein [Microvirga sp.]